MVYVNIAAQIHVDSSFWCCVYLFCFAFSEEKHFKQTDE